MPARPASQVAAAVCFSIVMAGCKKTEALRTPAATPAQPASPVAAPVQAKTDSEPVGDGITAEAARAFGPPAPANLAATFQSGAVHLSWMPGSGAAKEFRLYRFTGADPTKFVLAGVVRSTPTSPVTFDDANVTIGTTYTYFVAAVDEWGKQSGASNMFAIAAK
jgi:hypothetical protein